MKGVSGRPGDKKEKLRILPKFSSYMEPYWLGKTEKGVTEGDVGERVSSVLF